MEYFRLYTGSEDISYAAVLKSKLFEKVFRNNVDVETFAKKDIVNTYMAQFKTVLSNTLQGGKRACFFPTSLMLSLKTREYKCKVTSLS